MKTLRAINLALLMTLAVACGGNDVSVGRLSIEVPHGWRVAEVTGNDLKITDGTIAAEDSSQPGTAKAVFDVYMPSTQNLDAFLSYLRKQHVVPGRTAMKIDGYSAVLLSYESDAFAGRQEALFIPSQDAFVLYRAAYAHDDRAFLRQRAAFRRAIRTIRFARQGAS